ncbi:hypothetical protein ACJX0J_037109, partial [Zea mays]
IVTPKYMLLIALIQECRNNIVVQNILGYSSLETPHQPQRSRDFECGDENVMKKVPQQASLGGVGQEDIRGYKNTFVNNFIGSFLTSRVAGINKKKRALVNFTTDSYF